MVKFGEKIKPIILGALLIATGLTYYFISYTPVRVFEKDTVYYMAGKNKDCSWNVYFENDVYLKRGSFSNIYIGLPAREKRGVVKGIVESTDQDLLLAFSFPGSSSAPPIVLTAKHDQVRTPIEEVRFKLFNSSVLTILVFKDQKRCISRYTK